MNELASGIRLGSYELVEIIGRTGMSEVWRAHDYNGQIVALKTISSQAGNDPILQARFLREGDQHQQLSHPAIVPILDFFEEDGSFYLVMQYIAGGSLEDRIENLQWKPLPIPEALMIARQILPALDYAHQHLVIHRDVKPSNILLDGERAFLSDFGIALALGRPRLTVYPQVMGTRCYMSPEQIRTPLQVTHLTDVYSFGCVLYEMLTGHQPYIQDGGASKEAQYAVLAKRVHEPPIAPRQWNPEISPRLERILLTSLALEETNRFPGCGSFLRALDGIEQEKAGSAVVVQPPPTPRVALQPTVVPEPKTPAPALVVNPTKRVSVAGNVIGALCTSALWTPFVGQTADIWVMIFLLCLLASNMLLLRALYKAWDAVPRAENKITPGKAVGLLFVPFYNLYWCWRVFPRLAVNYNQYAKLTGSQERPMGEGFYLFFCFFHFYLLPLLGALQIKPLAGWFLMADFMVLIPIMIGFLASFINRFAATLARQSASAAGSMQQVPG